MRLVVDTSRIIAALIRNSASRTILLSDKIEFITVNFTRLEMEEHKGEILEKAKISEKEFELILSVLLSHVQMISDIAMERKLDEAREIMYSIDPDDVPFIAAALTVENEGIWTDDAHFDRQTRIKVFKTSSLVKILAR
jgi:predicted nucleic acid-binding protein